MCARGLRAHFARAARAGHLSFPLPTFLLAAQAASYFSSALRLRPMKNALSTDVTVQTSFGLQPITEESDPTGEAGAPLDAGIIGAILRGPRS